MFLIDTSCFDLLLQRFGHVLPTHADTMASALLRTENTPVTVRELVTKVTSVKGELSMLRIYPY